MSKRNVIAIVADKDGTALIPVLFLIGSDKLTGDTEVDFTRNFVDARSFRKLGSQVMKLERKRVLKTYPGFVVETVAVDPENLKAAQESEEPASEAELDEVAATLEHAIDSEAGDKVDPDVDQDELDAEADKVETEGDEEEEKKMSSQLEKYRKGYVDSVSSSGKKSKISGDDVSLALVNLTPEEVMHAAEKVLGLADGELVTRYQHLNPGQRRMNAGNGVRAAIKREDITLDDLKKHIPGLH